MHQRADKQHTNKHSIATCTRALTLACHRHRCQRLRHAVRVLRAQILSSPNAAQQDKQSALRVVAGICGGCTVFALGSLAWSCLATLDLRLLCVFDSVILALRCGQSVAAAAIHTQELVSQQCDDIIGAYSRPPPFLFFMPLHPLPPLFHLLLIPVCFSSPLISPPPSPSLPSPLPLPSPTLIPTTTVVLSCLPPGKRSTGGPTTATRKYYLDYGTEMAVLLAFTLHYLHLLCLHGLSMTVVDLLLLLKIRAAVVRMHRRFSVHRAYLKFVPRPRPAVEAHTYTAVL